MFVDETKEELDTHLADLERRIEEATEEFYNALVNDGPFAEMWMFN